MMNSNPKFEWVEAAPQSPLRSGLRSMAPMGFCLLALFALSACGGDDSTIGNGDNGNGDTEPGGDTSGYNGLLTWRFGDAGEGSGIRLWQLQDSEFKITVDEGDQGGAHKAPLVSSDGRVLVYTVDPVTFTEGEWSQVQWLDMEAGELISLPSGISSQTVRASFGADFDQFASTVSFAERVYSLNDSEPSHYGAGVWVVGNQQAESLVESDEVIHCTRMDLNATFVVFDQPDGFYRVSTSGGSPSPVSTNNPALQEIIVERDGAGHCPYDLADDGNRLAFTGTVSGNSDSQESDLAAFFTDLNSGQTTRVAAFVDLPLVDWKMAANGGEGVLLFKDGESDEYVVHTVNLINPGATTEVDRFQVEADGSVEAQVAISGNGQVIARSGYDADGIHIKVMTSSGSDQRRIQGDAATMGDGALGVRF